MAGPSRLALTGALAALLAACAVPSPPDPGELRSEAMPNTKVPAYWAAGESPP